ncbi:MAG: hypothetical protein EHM58_10035 [Ignavibacteriae bacterium]|nr:MAG: hypothetical protein EHM58_10035 [Ignavibacteriota bacterium]
MFKPVIKYFICSLICINLSWAQTASQNSNTDISNPKNNIEDILTNPRFILYNPDAAKNIKNTKDNDVNTKVIKKTEDEESKKIDAIFLRPVKSEFPIQTKPEKQEFNIVNSFRENIKFGGFWDKYAIINFNPSVNLKPVEFISIYANENLSCFVPIKEAKEYIKMLCIHSAAILAVDNSVKLLFKQNDWIANAVGFVVKNLVTSILKQEINNSGKNLLKHDSYYFAVSVRF